MGQVPKGSQVPHFPPANRNISCLTNPQKQFFYFHLFTEVTLYFKIVFVERLSLELDERDSRPSTPHSRLSGPQPPTTHIQSFIVRFLLPLPSSVLVSQRQDSSSSTPHRQPPHRVRRPARPPANPHRLGFPLIQTSPSHIPIRTFPEPTQRKSSLMLLDHRHKPQPDLTAALHPCQPAERGQPNATEETSASAICTYRRS